MSVSFSNLSLDGTYVLQDVSSAIKCNDPLTEVRDRDAEMQEAMDTLYGPQQLNEKAANIRWKGESKQQRNSFIESRKNSNGVNCFDIAVDGPEALVFTQENEEGKLVRFWLDKNSNLTARIRYVNTPSHPASWKLEIFRNYRSDKGRWQGGLLVTHFIHRTVTNESELTVAKYVAVYFTRFS